MKSLVLIVMCLLAVSLNALHLKNDHEPFWVLLFAAALIGGTTTVIVKKAKCYRKVHGRWGGLHGTTYC